MYLFNYYLLFTFINSYIYLFWCHMTARGADQPNLQQKCVICSKLAVMSNLSYDLAARKDYYKIASNAII